MIPERCIAYKMLAAALEDQLWYEPISLPLNTNASIGLIFSNTFASLETTRWLGVVYVFVDSSLSSWLIATEFTD